MSIQKHERKSAVESGAVLSLDNLYRYRLTRRWGRGPLLCFVMLNPSTADATQDDPTIRRCIGFARRMDLPGIDVVNLFALRATDPKELTRVVDPIGPVNNSTIFGAVLDSGLTIAAWGTSVPPKFAEWPTQLVASLSVDRQIYCLGKTKDGHPRHPLYVRADAPLVLFAGEEPQTKNGMLGS